MSKTFVMRVQHRLNEYGAGLAEDGLAGPSTNAALDTYLPAKAANDDRPPKGVVQTDTLSPASRFDTALAEILRHEGGWVDHPADPGGATNRGVTLATLSDWLGRTATKAEVKALTVADVAPIYRERYWNAVKGDDLPAGVDLMVFDLAVNSGPGRAAKFLQEVVGAPADGQIGPATLAKVNALHPLAIIDGMAQRRERFYRGLGTFDTFGRGWMKRLADVTAKSKEMAQ